LITAISEGFRGHGLRDRLTALEAERAKLEDELQKPPPSPIRLHPYLAESYRRRVADLARHLNSEDGRTESLEIVRSLIERVAVKPTDGGRSRSRSWGSSPTWWRWRWRRREEAQTKKRRCGMRSAVR
jgi:site-specific DNA recombinase